MKTSALAAVLLSSLLLTACGGGDATAEEIAAADADRAAVQTAIDLASRKTTQPVFCNNGACK